MNRRTSVLLPALMLLGLGFLPQASAQFRRPDPSEWIPRMDENKNGMIEPDELARSRARMFVEPVATRAGLDVKKPIPIEALTKAMTSSMSGPLGERRDGQRRDDNREDRRSSSPPGGSSGFSSSGSAGGGGSAFGATSPRSGNTGTFGVSGGSTSSGATKGFGDGSTAGGSFTERVRFRTFAESLVKQYDDNKNGVLDENEWDGLKSDQKKADVNGDKQITVDELVAHLAGFSSGSATSSGSSVPGSSSGGSSSGGLSTSSLSSSRDNRSGESRSGDGRSSWRSSSFSSSKPADKKNGSGRFLSPMERLPKGIPDWFLKSDANQDGQVSMAEFATSWTDSKAEEFAGLDLDGDGFVTPKEALQVPKR